MSSRSETQPARSPIRLVIVADTTARARALADVLSEDDRLDVLSARGKSSLADSAQNETLDDEAPHVAPDVALAVALSPAQLPAFLCPLVGLSDAPEPSFFTNLKIHAWLPLSSSLQELSAALLAAACDLAVLTPHQLRQWRRQVTGEDAREERGDAVAYIEKLTSRELEVLRMLADGLGNKEIAAQLGLSSHTAKFHVAQILAKLGATSRTEAVTIGIRRGLVLI